MISTLTQIPPLRRQHATSQSNNRGQTPTGHRTSQKVRDLRLRKQLTSSTARPIRQDQPHSTPAAEWTPPAWVVKALIESGDHELLDAPAPVRQPKERYHLHRLHHRKVLPPVLLELDKVIMRLVSPRPSQNTMMKGVMPIARV